MNKLNKSNSKEISTNSVKSIKPVSYTKFSDDATEGGNMTDNTNYCVNSGKTETIGKGEAVGVLSDKLSKEALDNTDILCEETLDNTDDKNVDKKIKADGDEKSKVESTVTVLNTECSTKDNRTALEPTAIKTGKPKETYFKSNGRMESDETTREEGGFGLENVNSEKFESSSSKESYTGVLSETPHGDVSPVPHNAIGDTTSPKSCDADSSLPCENSHKDTDNSTGKTLVHVVQRQSENDSHENVGGHTNVECLNADNGQSGYNIDTEPRRSTEKDLQAQDDQRHISDCANIENYNANENAKDKQAGPNTQDNENTSGKVTPDCNTECNEQKAINLINKDASKPNDAQKDRIDEPNDVERKTEENQEFQQVEGANNVAADGVSSSATKEKENIAHPVARSVHFSEDISDKREIDGGKDVTQSVGHGAETVVHSCKR